jgi:hypothetical protein
VLGLSVLGICVVYLFGGSIVGYVMFNLSCNIKMLGNHLDEQYFNGTPQVQDLYNYSWSQLILGGAPVNPWLAVTGAWVYARVW